MIGETVGNYRVLKLIGQGGMGVVYLAEHPAIGRKAAIKVLRADTARSPEAVIRFFNEARAANAVRHPGVVEVFDYGQLASGASYIAMEMLEGESLAARLHRLNRLTITDAVEIATQTADVLAATHAAGVIHRDLKPDNLFLVRDPRRPDREMVKVLDFGVAKLNAHASGSAGLRTRTGAVLGTPVYMSPEQCRGARDVDQRTDVYALGAILYETLCGRPPFVSVGQGELMDMHINVPPEPPRRHDGRISENLERVILKALAKDPGERHQTMGALQRALASDPTRPAREAVVRPIAAVPTAPMPAAVSRPAAKVAEETLPVRRRSGWRWIAGAGGLALAAAVVIFARWQMPAAHRVEPAAVAAPARALTPAVVDGVAGAPAARAPELVAVRITSTPPGARVTRERDDADIGATPFSGSWPVAAGVERFRLDLDGYRSESFAVPLDRGVDLAFTLKKVAAREREPRAAPKAPATPEPAPLEPVPL